MKAAAAGYVGYALYAAATKSDAIEVPPVRRNSPKVLVIGGGFSGICMSIKLAEKGLDHVLVEKEQDLGGTWFLTKYPGAQCDVPSHGYSYSFEMNPDWSQAFATSQEIWNYQVKVAKKYGVYKRSRLGTRVNYTKWVESRAQYEVEVQTVATGEVEVLYFDYVVNGIGALHFPVYPKVPGVNNGTFQGTEMHTADYDPSFSVAGKRVVVIGSAASAVQLVPALAETAGKLTCIQRTPNWLAPQRSPVLPFSLEYGPFIRWCFRNLPGLLLLQRWAVFLSMEGLFYPLGAFSGTANWGQWLVRKILTAFMSRQLRGDKKGLAAKVIPNYAVGCKRIIRSHKFLPALMRDNVDLVTDRVLRIDPQAVVIKNSSGAEESIPCDVVMYATGYEVGSIGPLRVQGKETVLTGSVLTEKMVDMYYGVCGTDFPNSFMMLGPNTGLGHNSIIIMLETQANFIARTIELAAESGVGRIQIKQRAVTECMDYIKATLEGTVWKAGQCQSWYQIANGDVPTLWPSTTVRYMADLSPPQDLGLFECQAKPASSKI